MYISSDAPALASCDAFATWAQIAVKYVEGGSEMPLIRLDRRGLTVAMDVDAADRPTIGLPRRAQIIADSTSICELRLVARATVDVEGSTTAITLQPSRADDDALLWQALRAYQIHLGTAPSNEESGCSAALAALITAAPLDLGPERAINAKPGVCEHRAPQGSAGTIDLRHRMSCDVAFTLASREEAWFFSRWLDYHFAEVRTWARMNDAAADLREMFVRVAEHEVEARFVFQSGDRSVRAATETASRRIVNEAAHALSIAAEYWLASSLTAASSGSRRHAVLGMHADARLSSSSSSKQ